MQRSHRCRVGWMLCAISLSAIAALVEAGQRGGHTTATQRQRATFELSSVAGGVIGPDIVVSRIDGRWHYTANGAINNQHAWSVGTTACNLGDETAVWVSDTNQHPVIAQSLFRLRDGMFEQIGQSWLKHGFCALNGGAYCTTCQPTDPVCPSLGVGCSDTYGATLNGNPIYLGPKSEVNAATGVFPFPHASPTGNANLRGRLIAFQSDVDPALNAGATYFVQAQYVTPDEPSWGTHLNNCSYRSVVFDGTTFELDYAGDTVEQQPAIMAWAASDPDVEIDVVDVPGDGRLYVASRVSQVDSDTWQYEYAVFNMNSDRSVGSFVLPVTEGAGVSNFGFHDVRYHSGEPFDGEDWNVEQSAGSVTWSTVSYETNVNANALRWGTLYNFRLTSDAGPTEGALTLGLFKPAPTAGGVDAVALTVPTPGAVGAPCAGDMVSSGTFAPPPDGFVDGADLAYMLGAWGANPGSAADIVTSNTFAPPPDGVVDGADLAFLLGAWGACQ